MKIHMNIHRSKEYNHSMYLHDPVGCMVSCSVPIILPTKGRWDVGAAQHRYGATDIRLYVPP